MLRGCAGWVPLVLVAAAPWSQHAAGDDDDKARLFNTFYLKGAEVSWVVVLRQDRTFEISGPDGARSTGKFHASDKEIGIASRHLAYKFDDTNVIFTPTKKDATGNDLAGRMPPLPKQKATYLSQQNWKKLGRELQAPRAEQALKDPEGPALSVTPAPMPLARPASITGTYGLLDAQSREHTLRLAENGTFEYAAPDARKASGTFQYLGGELTLDSGFHRRHLAVALALNGVQVSRRDTDVLKPGDCLGELPPQDRSAMLWKKQAAQIPSPGVQDPPPEKRPAEPSLPAVPDPRPKEPPPLTVTPPKADPTASALLAQRALELFKAGDKAGAAEAYTRAAEAAERAGNREEAKRYLQNAFAMRDKEPPPVLSLPPKPDPAPVLPPVEKPPAPGRSLAELAGSYRYRPNPLVTETWTLQASGAFDYADSNGAKISGTALWEGDVLVLRAGEVLRRFLAVPEAGGLLTLTRAADDHPKITNDLATMSPSVLKSAKYEKKK